MSKKRVLVDTTIEVDPPHWWGSQYRDPEGYQRFLERWVRDFREFIRDHRSQDPINLSVVPVYEDRCSHCNLRWEEWEDGSPACCTKALEEWEAENADAILHGSQEGERDESE